MTSTHEAPARGPRIEDRSGDVEPARDRGRPAVTQTVLRGLILLHRYLGIPLGVLFVVWFASGIVMMYTGDMPRLTPERQLERRPPLDLAEVALSPAAAARRALLAPAPRRALLLTVLDRPAYRFDGVTVFADTGERLGKVGPAAAVRVASRFAGLPLDAVEHVRTLDEPDQWTLVERGRLPLHQLRVADAAGTVLYVSPRTGEVVLETNRRSRALAWLGAIPHWFYFTALRTNQPLWSAVVVWTATLGCLLAVLGLVLGVTQFRWRTRSNAARSGRAGPRIPYAGWMRWHYLTGVVFGVVTLTWVFSGLLSMEPYAWTRARGLEVPPDALAGGTLDLTRFPPVDPQAWARLAQGRVVKEIELLRIQDDPYYLVRTMPGPGGEASPPGSGPADLLAAADTLGVRTEPFDVEALLARLTAAIPGTPVVASELLHDYDAYYYARRAAAPLPVLRVKLGDPQETWVYVDPARGRVVASAHRLGRVERWLFNGLHSLDFAFWYDRRPLWDVGLIVLSLGGVASSGIGLWIGWGRVRRAIGRGLPARAGRTGRARGRATPRR